MDRAAVLAMLRRADETPDLPRLGGMARADGVVIASERFWALARRDGSITEGTMPSPPAFVRRVPLVRGLLRLGLALAPLFRGSNVARPRERLLLAAAVVAPFSLVFLPQSASLPSRSHSRCCSSPGSCAGERSSCTAPSTERSPPPSPRH